jgi:starch synthase
VRFAGLAAAAAFVAGGGLPGRKFSAVHAHDWQTGLVAPYMKFAGHRPGVLFTIHNLAFQGKFPAALFPQLGLPQSAFARDGIEYYGGVGFLKAALWFADRINTVSPTYAAEIATPALGMGLDGLIRGRADVTSGILNGIDVEEWNPATDAYLPARYSAADPSARAANKAALQAEFGLAPDPNAPLFAFIGRLSWQKGFDLVLEALPAIQQAGGQLALLGSGDAALEARGRGAAAANPRQVGAFIGFNERIARLVYGGADAVLVPSRFEPCGLVQLCALRYGAVPIVSRTGGLSDTVIDANPVALAAGAATGFMATPDDVPMLRQAILRAATLYRDPPAWRRVQANAMATDVSWTRSAALYAAALKDIAARG